MEKFVSNTLSLLAQERDAEIEEGQGIVCNHIQNADWLQSKGICITKLCVSSEYIGLYGKSVIVFQPSLVGYKSSKLILSTAISSGDIVGVYANGSPLSERTLSGIVVHKDNASLSVAFDELDSVELDANSGLLQLVKLSSDVTYQRMKSSLEVLRSKHHDQHLVRVLFDDCAPLKPTFSDDLLKLSFYNINLDESQKQAVISSLARPDVAIIHGPPGTGKTTTVVEFILQSVHLRQKVLACAPSNIAVDNIAERLAKQKIKVIRLGHPARLSCGVQSLCLDALLKDNDSATIILDVRKDIKKAIDNLRHCHGPGEKGKWKSEIKFLKKELQDREQNVIRQLLKSADVILATTSGSSLDGALKHLPAGHFHTTVIDECAQAIEASCWIPLLHSPKCVLAGDHKQLPPTILSKEAAKNGLSLSLMERLIQLYGDNITTMLTVQYRMHEKIMSCSSKSFYGGLLSAHLSVRSHILSDLPGVSVTNLTSIPLLFIETCGYNLFELETSDELSKGNEGEADLVIHHLKALVSAGVASNEVAVIAPYSLQVNLIRKRLIMEENKMSEIEVHTVDGFQGREKEAVVLSFTRSNSKGECGFLHESRRINVAVTRARRHLTLIGDSTTIMHEPFIRDMINYCHEVGDVWTAYDYLNDPSFETSSYYKPILCASISKPQELKAISKKGHSAISLKESTFKPTKSKPHQTEAVNLCLANSKDSPEEISCCEVLANSFESDLLRFINGPDELLEFPNSLTSNERRVIHEICEKLNLNHMSKGQRNQRYIEVRKRKNSVKVSTCDASQTEVLLETTYAYPREYSLLPSKSPKKKNPQAKQSINSEGLDILLAEVHLMDSMCAYSGCKKSVNLISVKCTFCCRRLCVEHSLPEIHGCGEAARRNARSALKPVTKASTRRSSSDRSKLQKKLHEKLEKISSKPKRPHKK